MINDFYTMYKNREPYENLANAIVLRAVKDYRRVLRRLKRKPRNKDARLEKQKLEHFFLSDWYDSLTDIDGEMIIKEIRKEFQMK